MYRFAKIASYPGSPPIASSAASAAAEAYHTPHFAAATAPPSPSTAFAHIARPTTLVNSQKVFSLSVMYLKARYLFTGVMHKFCFTAQ